MTEVVLLICVVMLQISLTALHESRMYYFKFCMLLHKQHLCLRRFGGRQQLGFILKS